MPNLIQQLRAQGQSVWLDYIRRSLITSGELDRMVRDSWITGMTSNPTIFRKALAGSTDYDDDLRRIAALWNHGSVVRSWLLELAERAFEGDPRLETLRAHVDDSGEGRWTVIDAVERGVPAGVIAESIFRRFDSRDDNSFAMRVIAAPRREFGGHAVKES